MSAENSITVIISALNEEQNLEATVATVRPALRSWEGHEILIFDDGSTDLTGPIAERLAARHPEIKVVHHDRPLNRGAVFRRGIKMARMSYVMLVNGKNDITLEGLERIFAARGEAELVVPFQENFGERPFGRRVLSRLFTAILNLVFGLRLRYYNHSVLCRKALLNEVRLRSDSYAFQAEAMVKLILRGHSFLEVGVRDRFESTGRTRAFRIKNIAGVARDLAALIVDVYARPLAPDSRVETIKTAAAHRR